jgi:hypothetical protein
MKQNQHNEGQADRIRSGLQWLGSQVRELKFGAIRGTLVRDGVIIKGPKFRITRTGKPGGKGASGTRVALANDAVLQEALRDLARETIALTGEWKLKVKVANGTLLSWDVEEAGLSTLPETK